MKDKKLDEASVKIYRRLLEDFGEPIGKRPTTYGVPDSRVDEEKTCEGCGYNEGVCECGMNESNMSQVTPKGYEKIVRGIKRSKSAENPWAIAWWMKNKGIKPKKKK